MIPNLKYNRAPDELEERRLNLMLQYLDAEVAKLDPEKRNDLEERRRSLYCVNTFSAIHPEIDASFIIGFYNRAVEETTPRKVRPLMSSTPPIDFFGNPV